MKVSLSIIFITLWAFVAAKKDDESADLGASSAASVPSANIAEVASSLPDFSTLVALVTIDDPAVQPVLSRLTGDAPTTVFAPTNAAFAALPTYTVQFLQSNPAVLAQVLLYHAVDGAVPSSAITTEPLTVATLLPGANVVAQRVMEKKREKVVINQSTVVIPDVIASNGVIHAIDKVLLPPGIPLLDIVDLAITNNLSTLATAVTEANLVDVLKSTGPFTVFAPSEDAWKALPAGLLETLLLPENEPLLSRILQYHVFAGAAVDAASIVSGTDIEMVSGDTVRLTVAGGAVTVNDSTVVAADLAATNGIVHVIDKILIPPGVDIPRDIVDIALADPDLSSLVNALVQADLVSSLDTAGPFTVFAPTNAAFAALGDVSLDVGTLKNILLYHVASGAVLAETVVTLPSVTTLNGQSVSIRVEGGNVFLGDAQVIMTDIIASNGVIHKINAVLMPPPRERPCRYAAIICYALSLLFG